MVEAGQRESAIPDPLTAGSWRVRLGTLGLPAAMLSWGSLAAFLIVLAAVQHSAPLRAHYAFFLPRPWLAALGAAALGWAITIAGSRRPGRLWPRLWALALAGLASLVASATLVRPGWLPPPQLHALVTATLAGTLALAPRLAHLHPDSEWTQRIAPLSVLLTLGLILPLALIDSQGHPAGPAGPGVDAATVSLKDTERALRTATQFDWSRFDLRLPQAEQAIVRLRALPQNPLAMAAAAPAPGAAWAPAAQELMRAVADSLDPDRPGGLPRLSSLGLGAADLAAPSRVVAGYFEQIDRLFLALDPARNGIATGPLPSAYAAISADFSRFLKVIGERWSDAWAVTLTAPRAGSGASADLTPRALLGKTLFTWQGADYRANDLARLWDIDLATARRLQPGGRNDCGGLAFEQPGREYRIDCFAYAPAPGHGRDQGGAQVSAELRIVYAARAGGLTERAAPAEIWYAFAVAPGATPLERDRYQRTTLRAFLDALQDAGLTALPGGGNAGADQGWRIKGKRRDWMLAPALVDHRLADRDWVVIRVFAN